ncbi:MAG: hypothetical protein HYY02_09440 [Chloroflexi bacterium]|nr:hypothetical protein [Chloroflexota bacterium]
MRTLSTALTTAQKALSHRPYVEVKVRQAVGAAPRPAWGRLYTGAEADDAHALAIPTDGSLIRLRIDTATKTLYRQRVTSPGLTSDYSVWTSWRPGSRLCALAQYGAKLLAFAVDDATPTQIHLAESADNGATWGAWTLPVIAAGAVTCLAAASKGTGDTVLFFAVAATLYRFKRTAGVWDGAPTAWPNTVATITGVAAAYRNDWNLLLTGTETTTLNPTVWQLLYGDGYSQTADTFSALAVITPTSAGANVVFDSPFLTSFSWWEGVWLATQEASSYTENYTGAGGYNRPWWSHNIGDFVNNAWREPVPFNQTANNGLALAYASPYLWATTPFGVWRADVSAPLLDVSADVIAFTMDERPFSTRATIELNNASGKYNAPGSGTIQQLKLGSEVQLSPGYYLDAAAPAISAGPRLYVQGWQHTVGPQDQRLILHCGGPWELLARWRARRSYQWAAADKTISQIARFILARAGFDYTTLTTSEALTTLKPAFTIHPNLGATYDLGVTLEDMLTPDPFFTIRPGENGLTALRRLLAKVEDRIRFNNGKAFGVWPQAIDNPDYKYGDAVGGKHHILAARYGTQVQEVNYVQTLAGATLGEAADWTSIAEVYDRVLVDQDTALTTEAQADARASATLRKSQMARRFGSITVPANVGQELFDTISIYEDRIGLAAAWRRVMGIHWVYATGKEPRFEQEITLADA